MIFNIVSLAAGWIEGSRQEESQSSQVFDRFKSGQILLAENNFNLTIVSSFEMPENIGHIVAYQQNGKKDDTELDLGTREPDSMT